MVANRIPGSFRDPSGFLFRDDGVVYRQVAPLYREHYDRLLSSGFYREAVEAGLLLAHEEVDPARFQFASPTYRVLRPEQLPFISYPYEWSFSQLKDAALLTLDLLKRALAHGLWLKDASAYNVQFLRGRPVLIDTLSFEIYPERGPWVAYQQFCRQFLAPLALMAHRDIELGKLLRLYIDGLPLDLTSRLLPLRSRLSFALLTHIHLHARSLRVHADRPESARRATARGMSKTALLGLVDSLEGAVRRLAWTPRDTEWGEYYAATNYSAAAFEHKRALVAEFLDLADPRSVWDLGANTGEFSRIAADREIHTVAFDADPAAVEKGYRIQREQDNRHLLPLLLDLTNPSSGVGWAGEERMSLHDRGPVDLALALALIHHLAIGNNVPLAEIADFLHSLCHTLVVEFVPKSDSQVQRLLATRQDDFPEYTQRGFEAAFASRFELRRQERIHDSERILYLFEGR